MSELIAEHEKKGTLWLKLRASVPHNDIVEEYKEVWDLAVPHRMDYSQGWHSLTLHGFQHDWTEAINQYPGFESASDTEAPYHWTSIAHNFPKTLKFLKELPYEKFYRVRFMALAPGGFIRLHQDNDKPHLRALNVAITNPEGCVFRFSNAQSKIQSDVVPFKEGEGYFVNIGVPHEVKNLSNKWRLHMIIHGKFSADFYKNTQNYVEL